MFGKLCALLRRRLFTPLWCFVMLKKRQPLNILFCGLSPLELNLNWSPQVTEKKYSLGPATPFLIRTSTGDDNPHIIKLKQTWFDDCLSPLTAFFYVFSIGHLLWKVIYALEISYCLGLSTYTALYISEETKSIPHGNNPLHYEESRELMGVAIVMIWLTLCLFFSPER